jgi:hypothetical protein
MSSTCFPAILFAMALPTGRQSAPPDLIRNRGAAV